VDLERIKDVGVAAAVKAGEVLRRYWGKAHTVRKKGVIDLVTEADVAAEEAISSVIRTAFPTHSIHAEEGGMSAGEEACKWIIDPLDGTTNYAHGLRDFAVSVAFAYEGVLVLGVVFSPINEELFCAVEGRGATLNGRRVQVSNVGDIGDALLVTGFPYDLYTIVDPLMRRLRQCLVAAQGLRRLGSAALDLCHVACGRFDGFWEEHLSPWDTAAGTVIAREAGATVTDFSNSPYHIEKKEILATNGKIHEAMTRVLRLE